MSRWPSSPLRLWYAGGAVLEGGKRSKAKMIPEQVDKLIDFGQMALEQGWYDQAHDYFEQVLELDPSNREAIKGLARVNEILSRRKAVGPVKPEVPVAKSAQAAKPQRAGEPTTKREGKKRWLALAVVIPVLLLVLFVAYQRVQPTPQVDYARVYETQVAQREATRAAEATPTLKPLPTPTMTYRKAIGRVQRATVAIGVIDGEWCKYIGSGGIIDPTGLIITNAHVVKGRTLYCIVRAEYLEGETHWYYNARVAKRDTSLDLALLSIESHSDGSSVSDLSLDAVPMGDSDNVHTGDRIYVCGYPGVGGQNVTVTQGLVSGFEESRTLIKTDTEISPGSSGGVAITENGLLIGIPTSARIAPRGSGKIGYLIAVNEVRRFLGIVEDSEKHWVTPTPKPTATPKPVYTGPLVLATINGKGAIITDNFQLPACQQAVVYWSVSSSDADYWHDLFTVYLHEGTWESRLIHKNVSSLNNNGWVLQSFRGGTYYLSTKDIDVDASWTIRVECRDSIAPIQTGIDLHATGKIITDPYELPACQKSVFVWSVEPDDSSSAFSILTLALCGKDLNCITIVDSIAVKPTATLKGEALQPLSGGIYFLVSSAARGQAWSVRWECRD